MIVAYRDVSRFRQAGLGFAALLVLAMAGCQQPQDEFKSLYRQVAEMRSRNRELQQAVFAHEAKIETLNQQIAYLQDRNLVLHEPFYPIHHIQILQLTAGQNTDNHPGDDVVAVYVRPVDVEGDTLKRGGEILVRLFDNAAPPDGRMIGSAHLQDEETIRQAWYGHFLTDYFKIVAPLDAQATLRPGMEVDVFVTFIDWDTGRSFTARRVITLNEMSGDHQSSP